jgi:hypothetical protein
LQQARAAAARLPQAARGRKLRGAAAKECGMTRALKAGAFYALVVFVIGFATGAFRVIVLTPRFGEAAAVGMEAPVMLAASWLVAAWSARIFAISLDPGARIVMGLTAFAVLMASELGAAVSLFDRSMGETLNAYLSLAGAIGLAAQVAFAFIPLAQSLGKAA